MKHRIRLVTSALAIALAVAVNPAVRADEHNSEGANVEAPMEVFERQLERMSDRQLRNTIARLRRQFQRTGREDLKARLDAARQERKRRIAGGGQQQPPQPAPAPSQAEQQAQQLIAGPRSRQLQTQDLQSRIEASSQLLETPTLSRQARRGLQRLLRQDQIELQRRQAAQQISPAEKEARTLLQGPGSRQLETRQLRERIKTSRQLLQSGELREGTRNRLERRLTRDRTELQRRRAAQQRRSHDDHHSQRRPTRHRSAP